MYSKEKKVYIVVLGTCLLLAIILIYFFKSILKFHKRDLKDKLEIIYGKKGVLEEEKKRLGRELHDGVSSTLAGMKLMIESIQGLTAQDRKKVAEVSKNITTSITNLRYIMNDLMVINLNCKALPVILIEYIDKINFHSLESKLKIEHDIQCTMEFTYNKALHIYRIFQEAITNVQKHSNASLLKIQMLESDNFVEITFKDNGDGVNSELALLSNSGIGLNNIIYRTEILSGMHSIYSERNKGTEIKLKIPK
jgi:signal transduction histidine kinase